MEHRLWSSPERGRRKETTRRKRTCALSTLTSGLNQIRWSSWSTSFPGCVTTSMDILTRTWSPCCSGTSLPLYQVTPPSPSGQWNGASPGAWQLCPGALLDPLCAPVWPLEDQASFSVSRKWRQSVLNGVGHGQHDVSLNLFNHECCDIYFDVVYV